MSIDLSLVLDEEIFKELCKRYDGVIIARVRKIDSEHEDIVVDYHGGKILCVGLTEHVKDKLLELLRSQVK